ncbi:MAG: D-aminoacylase [Bryobacteraceae bacterium]
MRYAVVLALLTAAFASAQQPYDLIIRGGRIVDGTGNAWFYGDVFVRGDRIARIAPAGRSGTMQAKQIIDAKGMVVAPGFIDIQSHSRGAFLSGDGRVISKITQGITTEIMGEGATNAPANEKTKTLESTGREVLQDFSGPHGFRRWLEAMQSHGTSANFGSFVGATTMRMYGKGMAQGEVTDGEMKEMAAAMKEAMEDGAFGLASALIYPPGEYSSTRELIGLSKAMSPYGGVYITHMRSEADRLLEAIDEAIEIGRKGGVPVEIYHLKASGPVNWPKMAKALDKINGARAAGLDISADMYSYTAGGTGLTACLPPNASADGKLFDNLADPAMRTKIRQEVLHQTTEWENMCTLATPEGVLITQTVNPENAAYTGKRLSEIAKMQNKHWLDAAMDLILSEHRRVETIYFMMSEDNIKAQLRQPWIKFGTDAAGLDPETAKGLAHPRSYGNYPRILGKYVREEKVIPLEDAIRKMSSAVATRLSIPDRGLIKEGMFADIVVFNPDTVGDLATYEKPHQISVGIRDVLVNGQLVVREGQHTGAKPGRMLLGPGAR